MSEQLKTSNSYSLITAIVRWVARLTAIILGAFLLMFIIGEGPPPLHVLAPFLVVLAGFGLGWTYEALGAALILGAFIFFNVNEYLANGRLLRFGAFHLLLIPGLAFLICWMMDRKRSRTVCASKNPLVPKE